LAACQTTTDPADGGFFAGVSGIATGAYDDRIEAAEGDTCAYVVRTAKPKADRAPRYTTCNRPLQDRLLQGRRLLCQIGLGLA
jgi:hypothetical protein